MDNEPKKSSNSSSWMSTAGKLKSRLIVTDPNLKHFFRWIPERNFSSAYNFYSRKFQDSSECCYWADWCISNSRHGPSNYSQGYYQRAETKGVKIMLVEEKPSGILLFNISTKPWNKVLSFSNIKNLLAFLLIKFQVIVLWVKIKISKCIMKLRVKL